jgi:putative DNA primase/helicase
MAKEVVRSIYREAAEEKRSERRAELVEWARRSEARRYVENMVVLAQSDVPVWPKQLDADGWLLNCANGTVDLRTGALRPHQPKDLLTKSTGVPYDPEARCPRFKRFLLEIMNGNRQMVRFLRRALGYSLTGDVREQCLFLPHGSGSISRSPRAAWWPPSVLLWGRSSSIN